MASRNGNASVTPAPLSTVLRERCFFVMNMCSPVSTVGAVYAPLGAHRPPLQGRPLLAERLGIDDSQNDRRKLVIVFRGPTNNRAHLRHIKILQLTVEGVHHH